MRRPYHSFAVALAALLAGVVATARGAPDAALALSADDRVLVLAPHPDDEVIACAGVIQRAKALGRPVRVAFLTHGDNNEWSFAFYRSHPVLLPAAVRRMGEVRHGEALAALGVLGVPPDDAVFLGYPDSGTLAIWCAHWGAEPPLRGRLTRADAVPYPDARRPGAPHKAEEILADLEGVIRDFRPTKVFVSHPGDHHPDHQALYLFATVALWDLDLESPPPLLPYLVHFRNWPQPKGCHPRLPAAPPAATTNIIPWRSFALLPAEVDTKRRALDRHRTQVACSASYLYSFVRRTEPFGDYPVLSAAAIPALPGRPVDDSAGALADERAPFLEDRERATFVGMERRELRLAGTNLEISVTVSRPLMETTRVSIYAFGYRRDRPFAQMPKIHVRVESRSQSVYDQGRELPAGVCTVSRSPRETVVSIPLHLLGDPERILTSARTYAADVPLDWVSWRTLGLDGTAGSPATEAAEAPPPGP